MTMPSRRIRLLAGLAAAAILLTSCTGGDLGSEKDGPETVADATGDAAGEDDGPILASALDDLRHPDFPEPLIDPDDVLSGGPPPDGIRSIDKPQFDQVGDVTWLEDDEPVLSLTVGDETRAYPVRILMWHEIVNDVVDGIPVAVTYCPLCNSGVAFDRRVQGKATTFGVSGLLYADNLVMYDRRTETLWPQLTGAASIGTLTGEVLDAIPMGVVGWAQFREEHPDAPVLNRVTGVSANYGANPYVGYDDPDSEPYFELPGEPDSRLPIKARVIGLGSGDDAVAVTRELLAEEGVQQVSVGDRELVLFHAAGQVSALDESEVAEGEEIGTVLVFDRRLDSRLLDFAPSTDGTFRDEQTGSVWNIFGRAVSGPLSGRELTAAQHLDTFWFAWAAFQPDTDLVAQ